MNLFDTLQKQFFESYKTFNETAEKIIELLNLKESYTVTLKEEIEAERLKIEEVKNREAKDTQKTASRQPYELDPNTYDKSIMINVRQDRMFIAKKLLSNRIKASESKKETITSGTILKTHSMPFYHNWRPTIQTAESFIIFEGVNYKSGRVIEIPQYHDISKSVWDFRLEVEGEFSDLDLDTIAIEINGMDYDKYRRILYSKPIPITIPGHKDLFHIPLEFWMKDMSKSLCRAFIHSYCYIIITNVPDNVKIRLIAKELIIDYDIARIIRKQNFTPIRTHKEVIIPIDKNHFQFSSRSSKISILRYGFMTINNEKIYDVIKSIDGIPIHTLYGTQKIDCNDTVIWFDLICPIRTDILLVKFERKLQVPIRIVYEESNFILETDGSMVLRYVK